MLTLTEFIRFFSYSILLILLASCLENNKKIPEAKKGIIDLTEVDFEKIDFIILSGEYEFYWLELISPEDFKTNNLNSYEFFKLPGIWNNKLYNGKKLNGEGFATFRLKFILSKPESSLAMY
ncbi:MAG: hypothetical protein ACP5QT_09295 [Brevinematia bacterium]